MILRYRIHQNGSKYIQIEHDHDMIPAESFCRRRWLHAFLLFLLPSLGFRLQLVGLAPVRNYKEGRQLCAASVVRNVGTLLQLLSFEDSVRLS